MNTDSFRLFLPVCCLLFAALLIPKTLFADTAGLPQTFTLSFDNKEPAIGPIFRTGLLHGMDSHTPPDGSITPLHMGYWRSGRIDPGYMARINRLGAAYQLVLGDSWGYGPESRNPGAHPKQWAEHVKDIIAKTRQHVSWWEPWNEPDHPAFWSGSEEEWQDIWAIAWKVIRQQQGKNALIAGPSLARYNIDRLVRFADFLLVNDMDVNILTWHALGGRISALPDQVAEVQARIIDNPRYKSLNIQTIHIDEFGTAHGQYSPGTQLTWLRYLDQTGVTHTARACWKSPDKTENHCNLPDLVGMTRPADNARSDVWHLYAWHAAYRAGKRYIPDTTPAWLPVLQWADRDGNKRFALAGLASTSNAPETAFIDLPGSPARIYRLDYTGTRSFRGPVTVECDTPCNGLTLHQGDVLYIEW